jgi:hypothetical protein
MTSEIDGPSQAINKALDPSRIKIEGVDIVSQVPERPVQGFLCGFAWQSQ